MPASMKDFKVLTALGKGSYGSVMKVERVTDSIAYAVKEVNIRRLTPRERYVHDDGQLLLVDTMEYIDAGCWPYGTVITTIETCREDALNEIRILASIKHRNIIRYCDAFTEKDNLYIVMEFAEGGDIGRQIEKFKKANKYIKEDTIWSYTIQICRALNDLHSRSILHRDLKPKNVFLTGKNHVRLGDLGCAKLMKSGLARTQIGTPYYMSPEIWASKPYDHKSDIWALGCLLYELAMLAPPFLANDINGLSQKVKTTTPARISKHYSDELAGLVAAMLSKDPKMRPDAKAVLCMPAVAARLHLVPDDDESAWAGEDMRSALLATIRVPHMFGYGGKANINLPAPAYPNLKRSDSAPSSLDYSEESHHSTTPPKPSSMEYAPVGGAGLPPKPVTAPRMPFAAATSPPQLGRYGVKHDDKPLGIAEKLARAPPSAAVGYPSSAAGPAVKPLVTVPSAKNLIAAAPYARPSVAALPPSAAAMQPSRPAPKAAEYAPRANVVVPSAAVRKYLAAGAPTSVPTAKPPTAGIPSVPLSSRPAAMAMPSHRPSGLPPSMAGNKYVYPSSAAYGVPSRPSVPLRGF